MRRERLVLLVLAQLVALGCIVWTYGSQFLWWLKSGQFRLSQAIEAPLADLSESAASGGEGAAIRSAASKLVDTTMSATQMLDQRTALVIAALAAVASIFLLLWPVRAKTPARAACTTQSGCACHT